MLTLRAAWRSLARSRGFVAVAIIALALGLGLATTMFGVMDAVVNPWVPYRHPEQLYDVTWRLPRFGEVTAADVYRAVTQIGAVGAIEPVAEETLPLEAGGQSREVGVGRVRAGYFTTIGIRPQFGRTIEPADGPNVAMVSHALWRSLYGFRRSLGGAVVRLGGVDLPIVGVLPDGASHPGGAAAWLPLSPSAEASGAYHALVRLKAGVRYLEAANQLTAVAAELTSRLPPDMRMHTPVFIRLAAIRQAGSQVRDIHVAMVAASVIVLLIACVNLAHLMLARGISKRREFAIRLAIGARRATIVRQMFLECFLITVAGGLLGALAAMWGSEVIANRMPTDVSWVGLVKPHLSWRVFGVSALAAAVAAVVFGLIPAIGIALDVNLDEPLKDGAGTTTRRGLRYSPLVIFEVAIALVLLMSGGLLLRTVGHLERQRFDFPTQDLLAVRLGVNNCAFDSTLTICRVGHLWRGPMGSFVGLAAAIQSLPGVRSVAFVGEAPARSGLVSAEQTSAADSDRTVYLGYFPVVSPRYLETIGLPILSGRDFEPGDAAQPAGAAIIDPVAAAKLYPRQDPVGRMLKLGSPRSDAPWVRIVGVARNPGVLEIRGADMSGSEPGTGYLAPAVWIARRNPMPQVGRYAIQAVIRTEPHQGPLVSVEVKRSISHEPGIYSVRAEPYAFRQQVALDSRRFLADVFVAMGAVALGLAALGLYSVLAYMVTQRLREFAVRVALGATEARLFGTVMHDALVMLLAGTGAGAFVAMAAMHFLDAIVAGVYLTDAPSLAAAEVLLVASGACAALVPARRALKASPLDIMRAV